MVSTRQRKDDTRPLWWAFPLLMAVSAMLPAQALLAQDLGNSREARFRSGLMPIAIALADSFPYDGADAVMIRRPDETPHDVILMDAQRADPELLVQAYFTLYAVQSRFETCPPEPAVVRVTDRSGIQPPDWRPGDPQRMSAHLAALKRAEIENLPGLGTVRFREIWVMRYFNAATEPFGTVPLFVCPADTLPDHN